MAWGDINFLKNQANRRTVKSDRELDTFKMYGQLIGKISGLKYNITINV